jgi:hypothetical protein
LDFSSTSADYQAFVQWNSNFGNNISFMTIYSLNVLYLPAYYDLTIQRANAALSSQHYFDAWYLRDFGIADSYQEGLDAETDGILTDYLGTDAQQIGWVLIGIAAILFAFKGGK